MPRRDRTVGRRVRLAALVALTSVLGLAPYGPATAQDGSVGGQDPGARTGDELFGTYDLEARGSGVQVLYNMEDFLPGGATVLDLTVPETLARFGVGPSGYGLASVAFPGGVLTNLSSLLDQASPGAGADIPDFPVKAEAFYPGGPTQASSSLGSATQVVRTGNLGVQAQGTLAGIEADPLVHVGGLTSASRTAIEDGVAVSRTRVALGDVRILGGVLTIDSVVTDLVAVHDGTAGSTAGGTVASGVRFLGLAASLTEEGLVLTEAPAAEGPGAPAGSPLADLVGPLQDLTAPIRDLLAGVLQQATPALDDLLGQAGLRIRILDPQDGQVSSGAANRASTGLEVRFSYAGREQQALGDLIGSLPDELKPALGPLPNPLTFLTENHVVGLALAPAHVTALATPAFDVDLPVLPDDAGGGLGDLAGDGFFDLGPSPAFPDPGFATSPAPLPSGPGSTGAGPGATGLEPISATAGAAVPGLLVALLLLGAPLFGVGSSRLADAALAPAGSTCPRGLDEPPAPARPS